MPPPLPPELSHVQRFGAGAHNYTTLLLEDERGILYVGARGAIFALNASAISDGSHRTVRIPWRGSCLVPGGPSPGRGCSSQ